MGKNKLKRRLNTSSSSSNFGDVSLNISEGQKFDPQMKNVLQKEVQKVLPAAHETTSGLTENIGKRKENEGDDIEDEEVSNSSYNSTGNLCASNVKEGKSFDSYYEFRAKRSQSLEGRPWQMKNGSTYSLPTYSLATNTNSLIRNDFLKVVSTRGLEGQRSRNDFKEGKCQQIAHPKKKIKTSIYLNPVFDSPVDNSPFDKMDVGIHSSVVEKSLGCNDASEKCIDDNCVDEFPIREEDVNLHVLSENKIIEMSHSNVAREESVTSIEKSILIPNKVTNKSITKQVSEHKINSHSRPPLTEEQKKRLKEVQLRTVFIEGHKDEILKYYRHKPRQLNKEIFEKTRGEVERIFITKQGVLKIIAKDEAQKNQLLKIKSLNDGPVRTSIPFSLTSPSVSNNKPAPAKKKEPEYFVKGVVFGLLENEENLNEIALEIGAHHIQRLGNQEFSKATLVAYPKGTVLPEFLEVDGRRYKVYLYIPKPLRCDRCQFYGHRTFACTRDVVCSRCGGSHSYTDCPDKNNLKCANCAQAHSAAHKSCPVYIKTQTALRIRAEQNIPFADAMIKVDEIQSENVNNALISNNVTYVSKVKTGIENKIEIRNTSLDMQPPNDDQIASNGETFHSDLVKRFLSFDKKDYKATNTCKPMSDAMNDCDPITQLKMSFVLGVLAAIDKAKSRKHAQFEICHAASEILFNKEIEFSYKDW